MVGPSSFSFGGVVEDYVQDYLCSRRMEFPYHFLEFRYLLSPAPG